MVQLVAGVRVAADSDRASAVRTIAVVVVICFLIGIARSGELAGGPSIGLRREVGQLLHGNDRESKSDDWSTQAPARAMSSALRAGPD